MCFDRALLWLLFAVMLTAVSSCNKEHAPDCVTRGGITHRDMRELSAFHRIELRDYIHYELIQDARYAVEVEGPVNLLDKIFTSVDGGQLIVRNRNTCNFVRSFRRPITVRIFAPDFREIQNYATGNVTSPKPLHLSRVIIENRNAAGMVDLQMLSDTVSVLTHTGVCDVRLGGDCAHLELFSQGVGIMDARGMIATQAYVNNSSINDVYVRASAYLYAHIRFSGRIYVSGHPTEVQTSLSGSGQLIYTGD